MEILIRSAETKDYLDVQEIHAMPEVYSGTLQLPLPSEELWKKRLSDHPESVHLYVAEADGKVVGFAGLDTQQKARRKHVGGIWICVHDHWHNKGIATQLLAKVVDIAENWLGITRMS